MQTEQLKYTKTEIHQYLRLLTKNSHDVFWQIGADFQAFSTSNSISRCDMMFAMFSHNDFREKVTNVVHFPGISKLTFGQLLHYLYTDRVTSDRATSGISTSSIFNSVSAFCNKKINGLMCRGNAFLFPSSQQLLVSVSDPWRAFWADMAPFKGPRLSSCVASGTTETQRHRQVYRARRGCPKTPSKAPDSKPWLCTLIITNFSTPILDCEKPTE